MHSPCREDARITKYISFCRLQPVASLIRHLVAYYSTVRRSDDDVQSLVSATHLHKEAVWKSVDAILWDVDMTATDGAGELAAVQSVAFHVADDTVCAERVQTRQSLRLLQAIEADLTLKELVSQVLAQFFRCGGHLEEISVGNNRSLVLLCFCLRYQEISKTKKQVKSKYSYYYASWQLMRKYLIIIKFSLMSYYLSRQLMIALVSVVQKPYKKCKLRARGYLGPQCIPAP